MRKRAKNAHNTFCRLLPFCHLPRGQFLSVPDTASDTSEIVSASDVGLQINFLPDAHQ